MTHFAQDQETDRVAVHLPGNLWRRVQRYIAARSFASVDDFVVHAVREVMAREEALGSTGLTSQEEQRVKARLRALGYLD